MVKMIKRTYFDKKNKKYSYVMIPESEEHRKLVQGFPKVNPLTERAEKYAHKIDPHWEKADRPSETKGHKAYQDYINKHKK